MSDSDETLMTAATTAVEQCLNVTAGEMCVVVTDEECDTIGRALYAAAKQRTEDVVYISYPPGETHGQEPPQPIANALQASDVFFAPTSKSLSHTRARQHACANGARGVTLPGITPPVFTTGLDADYEQIATHCDRLIAQLAGATNVTIKTARGTDLTVETGERDWNADTGIVHEEGAFSNLPAGEVYISPTSATGTVVIDGTMPPHGRLTDPIELIVEDGYVIDISDETITNTVETAAEAVGKDAYNLAELGIGANVGVSELVGSVLLDEKAAGTAHVAIGDDAAIGGDTNAPIHLDGIFTNPTIEVDGRPLDLPS